MKVYEITLELRDQFLIYTQDNGLITLATDKEHPNLPYHTLWDKETNTWPKQNSIIDPIRVVFSTFGVKKEDYTDFLIKQIPDLLQMYDKEFWDSRDIVILKKDRVNYYEVGMGAYKGHYPVNNKLVEDFTNRYLSLKAFW
jgi:hypothetical protein